MSTIKQSIEFYANVIVSIMLVVVTGFYIANVNQPYYQDMNSVVLTTLVATLMLSFVPFGLRYIHSQRAKFIFSNVFKFALPSFIIFSGVRFLAMRVESFGYIFASNLEAGNEAATTAATQAVLLLVLFVVTWFLSVVTAFLSTEG
ncbi:hypothetical protein ABPH35_02440 [Streptococcus sp. ZJ93]|uniref:hypothetical protein n=1 Tax=Streptococcus handemini TaxID=3161188 RepID=UPI0034D79F29